MVRHAFVAPMSLTSDRTVPDDLHAVGSVVTIPIYRTLNPQGGLMKNKERLKPSPRQQRGTQPHTRLPSECFNWRPLACKTRTTDAWSRASPTLWTWYSLAPRPGLILPVLL